MTKKYFIIICLFLLFFGFSFQVQAATYYIDYEAGNDSNLGTSKEAAWKHCPGDSSAINNANKILQAGDIVIFKGGVEYTGNGNNKLILINSNGTSGNYITYRGNTDGENWGNGKAKINLDFKYYHAFYASSKNYIQIVNFDIYYGKNVHERQNVKINRDGIDQVVNYAGSGLTTDLGIITNNAGSNWLIKDCIFHESENWEDRCVLNAEGDGDPATITSTPLNQNQIRMRGPNVNNIEIANCEFFAFASDGIALYGTQNVNIHNCNFGGIDRGSKTGYFSVAVRIEASSNPLSANKGIYISDNTFHDGWQYEGDEQQGRCHAGDWIHIYGISEEPKVYNDGIYYERNFWYNDKNFSNTQGSAMSQIEEVDHMYVRNNILVNPHAGHGTMSFTEDMNNLYFENNTVVVYPHSNGASAGISVNSAGNNYIRNNIFLNFNIRKVGVCVYNSSGIKLPIDSNNNIYYSPNGAEIWRYASTFYSFEEWKSFSGKDVNSFYGNPNLLSVSETGENSSKGNYNLSSLSLNAINKGINLSGFNNDYSKISRPQGSQWDIGAYEYNSGQPTCTPGDANCDGKIDITDFTSLVSNWLKTGTNISGDVNNDSKVNAQDLGIMMSKWGN